MLQFTCIFAVVCCVVQIKANLQGPCKGKWEGKIDNAFIENEIGFETEGSVFMKNDKPEGGVLIGRNLDLDNTDEQFFLDLNVPQHIIDKLSPYFGLKGKKALKELETNPLSLTDDEAATLSTILLNYDVEVISLEYNSDVDREGDPTLQMFEALTMAQRTAIVSVFYEYGLNGAPVFWREAVEQNWNDVIAELEKMGDTTEAALLENDTGDLFVEGQSCADPHLRTFDGMKYSYQGFCSYVLTQSVDNADFPAFQVSANFSGVRNPEKPITRMVDISLLVEGVLVVKLYQDNTFEISGKRFAKTSRVIGDGNGDVYTDEMNVYVQVTKPKLLLTWCGRFHRLSIRLEDSRMLGNVVGLLGDANGVIENELRKPDGTTTTDIVEFGDSWEIPGSC